MTELNPALAAVESTSFSPMELPAKTFRCQMNFAGFDETRRHLKERGYLEITDDEAADALIFVAAQTPCIVPDPQQEWDFPEQVAAGTRPRRQRRPR